VPSAQQTPRNMSRVLRPAAFALCCLLSSAESGDSRDAAVLMQSALKVHRESGGEEKPDPKWKAAAHAHVGKDGGAPAGKAPLAKKAAATPAAKHAPVAKKAAAVPAAKGAPVPKAAAAAPADKASARKAKAAPRAAPKDHVAAMTKVQGLNFKTYVNSRGSSDEIDSDYSMVLKRRGQVCEGDCSIHFGDDVSMEFSAKMPSGLQQGDQVAFHGIMTPDLLNSSNALAGIITDDPMRVAFNCEVCHGSCQYDFQWGSLNIVASAPTFANSNDYCLDSGVVKANLSKVPVMRELQMRIPGNMGRTLEEIAGTFEYEGSILRKDGVRRAVAFAKKTRLGRADGHSTPIELSATPSALAQVSAATYRQLKGAVQDLRELTGPFELTKAVFQTVSEATIAMVKEMPKDHPAKLSLLSAESDDASKPKHGFAKASSTVMYNSLKVNRIGAGAVYNYSVRSNACQTTDELGSFDCKYKWGDQIDEQMQMHIEANFEPGTIVRVKLQEPKLEGMMGFMAKQAFRAMGMTEFSAPLCGPEYTAKIGNKHVTMPSANCGRYTVDVTQKKNSFTVPTMDTFKNFYLPGNMQFPETALAIICTVASNVQVVHKDGTVLFDAVIETGTKRA